MPAHKKKYALRSKSPYVAILEAFVNSHEPLNKYQLEIKSKVARQGVYDWVPKLQKNGLIEVKDPLSGNERYGLTEKGWIFAAGLKLDPDKVPIHIQEKYLTMIKQNKELFTQNAELWLPIIRQVWIDRRARPGWSLTLKMRAQRDGHVKVDFHTGPYPV